MTAMAIVALGGLFSGCTREIEGGEGNSAAFDIVQNYETAFIDRFGQPAETQTWGFGPVTTRAVVDQPSVSEGEYTYNAQMTLAWQGVDAAITSGTSESNFEFMGEQNPWRNSGWSDKYYDVHGTVVASDLSDEFIAAATKVIVGTEAEPGLIPEQVNNLSKAESTGYSIVTTGGPVTLTPIYHNSNSGDRLSYYYYPVGSRPSDAEIKTMPKYSLGEMSNPSQGGNTHIYRNTYSLVYVDANGNCSYNFPANYVINFVISNTWGGQSKEIYQSGGITTIEGGTESSLISQGKFEVSANEYYQCGSNKYIDGKVQIRLGNNTSAPQFTQAKQGSSFTFQGNTFNWYMEGNGVNGSLDGGNTCYYFRPKKDGTINVGVKLNSGKKLYIKKLGSEYDPSSYSDGTSLSGFDGKTESADYTGVYSFPVESWNWYAVYAEGSKLGFYGFEFEYADWQGNVTKERDGVFTSALGPFDCGSSIEWGSVTVKLGKVPYFSKAKSNGSVSGYSAYTSGTSLNGGLSNMATTSYYFLAWNPGVIRVAVSLNENKRFYIKDLGMNGWDNTSGTSLSGYDGITVSSKYNGTYDFPVEANHVYAVYAEESKLGFYGCEFLTGTLGTPGTPTTTDIVKKTISVKPDYYSDSNLNQEIHQTGYGYGVGGYGVTDILTSHTAVYKSKVNNVDYTFVGFEDWIDFDFNDVILAITGTEPEKPHDPIVIPDPDPVLDPVPVCRIVAEDLTVDENGDFDFNDVVFDVCPVSSENKTILIIRAVGGELPLYIGSFDEAHEVHNVCGLGPMQMTNTGWDGSINPNKECGRITLEGQVIASRGDARNITIRVVKKNETITLSADPGRVPSKICVGTDYRWCRERVDIDDTYCKDGVKLFSAYVSGQLGDDWYKQMDQ